QAAIPAGYRSGPKSGSPAGTGWFVSGTQNIMEKHTEERRSAYLKLLKHADSANDNPRADRTKLQRAAKDAELICSDQMLNSGRINGLVEAVKADRTGHRQILACGDGLAR